MKTTDEWLQAFNLYYNNLTSNKAPGLEPVEISRLLSDAEVAIVVGLYNGSLGDAFESTEQVTEYLASLVVQEEGTLVSGVLPMRVLPGSKLYSISGALLARVMEWCELDGCGGSAMASVVPVTQDNFLRTKNNPFKGPNQRRVLRLVRAENEISVSDEDAIAVVEETVAPTRDVAFPEQEATTPSESDDEEVETGDTTPVEEPLDDTPGTEPEEEVTTNELVEHFYSELVDDGVHTIKKYHVRYLKRPEPIILADLPSSQSIWGKSAKQTCLLPEPLHNLILSEAVRMAKAIWQS